MKTKLGMTAAMALAAATLSACGNSTEDYCNSLEEAESDFASLGNGDFDQFGDAINRMRDIGGDAPDEVADDWEVLTNSIDEMEQSLEDAGLSFDDLGTLATGELREGVDEADVAKLDEAFQTLQSDEATEAGDAIDAHAKEECGITLS